MVLKVDGKVIEFFNSYNVTLHYNTVASTFGFSLYFDPENPAHKLILKPLAYKQCTVEHEGELLITGIILSHTFTDAPIKQLVSISGYSLPGMLEDCEIPASLYPLQSDGLNLLQIAQKILKPFGVKYKSDSNVSNDVKFVHKRTAAEASESIRSYLSSLASQINVVVSHTPEGDLLFTRADTVQEPIVNLTHGTPQTEISLSIDGQNLHSSITVIKQADSEGGNAGQATVNNPFVTNTFRPCVKILNSGNDNSISKAAKNALASELKSITLTVHFSQWNINKKIIRPNKMITVENPNIYLYNKVRWFVDSVSFHKDEKSETATLECVLPCVYDGSTPVNIFK